MNDLNREPLSTALLDGSYRLFDLYNLGFEVISRSYAISSYSRNDIGYSDERPGLHCSLLLTSLLSCILPPVPSSLVGYFTGKLCIEWLCYLIVKLECRASMLDDRMIARRYTGRRDTKHQSLLLMGSCNCETEEMWLSLQLVRSRCEPQWLCRLSLFFRRLRDTGIRRRSLHAFSSIAAVSLFLLSTCGRSNGL